jgi:hypothetical protein
MPRYLRLSRTQGSFVSFHVAFQSVGRCKLPVDGASGWIVLATWSDNNTRNRAKPSSRPVKRRIDTRRLRRFGVRAGETLPKRDICSECLLAAGNNKPSSCSPYSDESCDSHSTAAQHIRVLLSMVLFCDKVNTSSFLAVKASQRRRAIERPGMTRHRVRYHIPVPALPMMVDCCEWRQSNLQSYSDTYSTPENHTVTLLTLSYCVAKLTVSIFGETTSSIGCTISADITYRKNPNPCLTLLIG